VRAPYPEPPWTYRNTSILNVLARAHNLDGLRAFLPPGLDLQDESGRFLLWFLDVPDIPQMGPDYRSSECGMIIPAKLGSTVSGGHFAFMLVDNDEALLAGREIWGYPKKLARVGFRRVSDSAFVAEASHMSYRSWSKSPVVQVRAELDGSNDHLWDHGMKLEPRILSRPTRNLSTGEPTGNHFLTVENHIHAVHERLSGSATLDFGPSREEGLHELGEIDVAGALFMRCDFGLGYGNEVPR
jgi:acetoacetate decarboxylase